MSRTKFGKTRKIDNPYAIYKGHGKKIDRFSVDHEGDHPFGETEVRVLKTYQSAEKEKTNQYARWFVAVKSEFTYDSFDMGDSYIKEAIWGLKLVECEPEWKEEYGV